VPNIDPKIAFYLGLAVFIAGVIANAGVNFLTGALPADIIPPLVKWCAIVATLGNGILTYIAGTNMTNAGRLANVKSVPIDQKLDSFADNNKEVKQIVTTQALAELTNSDKVVGPPPATGTKS
jgi:hypothetical protein